MALASFDGDSIIKLTTPVSSKSYIDITIEVLNAYGVKVKQVENGYFIKGNQKFNGSLYPEGDWSNASAFLVLGAIAGDISVKGLNLNSTQGDRAIVSILKSAGALVSERENQISVKKSSLIGFTMDADNCPDLVPLCAVLGAVASGKTTIYNVQRLRLKESDRILSTMQMLKSFGIESESDGNTMIIHGGIVKGGIVDAFNDHRIVMASAVLGAVAGESVINGAEAVQKSYPTFFDDYSKLGGKISEI
jgi:3-phosphoshikimate 1-carboxyvinyltransferase